MSIFGAMDTAVSGLTSQSVAFSNISNNISNSQTTGYKAVDTSFSDLVEASGGLQDQSGSVSATTQYENQAQGTITASSANAALAISGNGFFAVNEARGTSTANTPVFSSTQYYTRAGDFSSDKNGYLVNSAGQYLDGYMVNATSGKLNTGTLVPINVNNVTYKPTATSTVTMAPTVAGVSTLAAGASGTPETSSQTVYDTSGRAQKLGLTWTQTAGATAAAGATPATGGTFTLSVSGTNAATAPTATVVFNADGSLQSIAQGTPAVVTSGAGAAASFNIGGVGADTTNTIALNLGTIGSPGGTSMTTASGVAFNAGSPTQDGTSAGSYTGFTIQADGSVMGTFDNGETQLIATVPLATFGDANALQGQDGQAYTASAGSGAASLEMTGQNGAGNLETKSIESSTSNLDTDLTKLIVAQQAYGASAKVVSTANNMLSTLLAMKQ
ncbi:flagellar hook-basal body complex protein [Lichenicoccus sp.]|uniref:flagellar hook-basal body complex protein n=1 Tax=Lichenicoccus sp. TaxID=2781899 RepID=UPI003D11262C